MELLIKKIIKVSNITISYSATILWLLFYNFICDYLNLKGIDCKSGIALGLLQHGSRVVFPLIPYIFILKIRKKLFILFS